ncbi:MAG: FmdB family zinc ribbon protein [Terriglobia bacterium]
MPLYEYQCRKCGSHFEKIRKFSDPPLTKCEKCGGKLEQLLSSPAIQFKGSGFYINDYAKKTAPEASKPATPEKPATGKPAETAKTSKPSETSKIPATK